MASIIRLPQIGVSEESAVLAQWHKNAGDKVEKGELLFTVETGKSSFEIPSELSGTILKVLAEVGEEYPIEFPVCIIGDPGENIEGLVPGAQAEAAVPAPAAVQSAAPKEAAFVSTAKGDGSVFASPRAKKLAEKAGIDWLQAEPSGAEGRVIERDVRVLIESGADVRPAAAAAPAQQAAAQAAPVQVEYEDAPLTQIRKVIAKSMGESLREIPQLTLNSSFDATQIIALRKQCKDSGDPDVAGITLGDMVMFAVSRTLREFPSLNAHFLAGENKMRFFKTVNLGFACDTPRGLIVPTVFNADKLSLVEISVEVKRLANAARTGNIDTALISGASFTVSNLGGAAIESFTPVINPPQTGILGVDNTVWRARPAKSGGFEHYPAMGLSITFDHRAIDGLPAGMFMRKVGEKLENLTLLLVK